MLLFYYAAIKAERNCTFLNSLSSYPILRHDGSKKLVYLNASSGLFLHVHLLFHFSSNAPFKIKKWAMTKFVAKKLAQKVFKNIDPGRYAALFFFYLSFVLM
jgi:hypothetical protein